MDCAAARAAAWSPMRVTAPGGADIPPPRLGGEASRINVARLEPVGPYRGWKPLMPVTNGGCGIMSGIVYGIGVGPGDPELLT